MRLLAFKNPTQKIKCGPRVFRFPCENGGPKLWPTNCHRKAIPANPSAKKGHWPPFFIEVSPGVKRQGSGGNKTK